MLEPQPSSQLDTMLHTLHAQDVRAVDLVFTDVIGLVKTLTIALDRLPSALSQGVWFDGSAMDGPARAVESDMLLVPDLATLAVVPWESHDCQAGSVARVFCDVYTPGGQPFAGDPRWALRRALQTAADLGLRYTVMPELEFYLLRDVPDEAPACPDDRAGYFDTGDSSARALRRRITEALRAMSVRVEAHHHEVGSGQHELALAPADALPAADAIITARLAARAIARQMGRLATFMPKPFTHAPGSGLHLHQWLYDLSGGTNRFASSADEYGLSAEGRAFLAGQLTYARAMCAVLAPLVNSYRRLMAGQEAPVYVTWAQLNRGALLRVPRRADSAQPGPGIEMRCPDPACNPYLALTVLLHAGLRGIQDGLTLPPAAEEELYTVSTRRRHLVMLPASLHEALDAFEASDLMRDALGLHLFERFAEAKRLEWQDYLGVVSPWELDRYLSSY